jgi:hypothetical protein
MLALRKDQTRWRRNRLISVAILKVEQWINRDRKKYQ